MLLRCFDVELMQEDTSVFEAWVSLLIREWCKSQCLFKFVHHWPIHMSLPVSRPIDVEHCVSLTSLYMPHSYPGSTTSTRVYSVISLEKVIYVTDPLVLYVYYVLMLCGHCFAVSLWCSPWCVTTEVIHFDNHGSFVLLFCQRMLNDIIRWAQWRSNVLHVCTITVRFTPLLARTLFGALDVLVTGWIHTFCCRRSFLWFYLPCRWATQCVLFRKFVFHHERK